MTPVVALVTALWLRVRRRHYAEQYNIVALKLRHAHTYLYRDRMSWASNISRGRLLPEQEQAIQILDKHCMETLEVYKQYFT